jgi:hypothetical protein
MKRLLVLFGSIVLLAGCGTTNGPDMGGTGGAYQENTGAARNVTSRWSTGVLDAGTGTAGLGTGTGLGGGSTGSGL